MQKSTEEPSEEISKPNYVCIEGSNRMINASYNGKSVADIEFEEKDLIDICEYGYGFWMRYLTRFPEPMYDGKRDPWYFVSRLTSNENYENNEMGDRLLAIF